MKPFDQLTTSQQKAAIDKAVCDVLQGIIERGLRFNDDLNHDDFQARIDAALEKALKMQTPWFAHEYIMDTCKEEIEAMAQCTAEDSLYVEKGESK